MDRDESIEREGYEHSNSLGMCQSCLVSFREERWRNGGFRIYCPICGMWEKIVLPVEGGFFTEPDYEI